MSLDPRKTERWYRSNDGIIAGVCAGLAEKLDVPVGIFRLGLLFSVFFFGFGGFLYIALAIILPREDQLNQPDKKMLLGVCQRLSKKLAIAPEILRFLAVILGASSLGFCVLLYIILHFVLEKESAPKIIDVN